MYTRSFYPEEEEKVQPLPENYSGVTFSRDEPPDSGEATEAGLFDGQKGREEEKRDGIFSSLGRLPFLSGLSDLPFFSSLKLPKIGTEELILIGVALYLFFSKDGDRECALMLLLLLLIN